MRIVNLSLHGCKAGTDAHRNSKRPSGLRGKVGGWSTGSTRRNIDFLRSVDYEALTGFGLAFTGTLLDCPATSDDWHRIRKLFLQRLNRLGLIRSHWVTEWQRRGVPHLHGMFFFPDCSTAEYVALFQAIINAWLELVAPYRGASRGVNVVHMNDALGWAQYSAKHASRGVGHYQRSPENIPEEWKEKTGRVWGKTGDWPIRDAMKFEVSDDVYYRFRRLARSWRVADARQSGNRFRIKSARRCLKANTQTLADVRGVSEWLPLDVSVSLLMWAVSLSSSPEPIEQVA